MTPLTRGAAFSEPTNFSDNASYFAVSISSMSFFKSSFTSAFSVIPFD